ncbi:MAG: [Fe-Fe] hydrogenase large subunit C-terminal domain-containing protein [Armatimonadota bacterium]
MSEQQTLKHYFHSVRLIEEKCKGCVNCIKHCPTEAIRVRDGKAQIIETRCVDCGECIRICQNKAKTTVADSLDMLSQFSYNIALPAPALFGQFGGGVKPEKVLAGLLHLGFDDVFEVGFAAEIIAARIRQILKDPMRPKPLLSSSCPAVVRLIQVRFPEFISNIVPVVSPMRLAARIARKQKSDELGIPPEEIGLFFISPCPGKVSAIVDPVGFSEQCIDGAIPIADIYPRLHNFVYNTPDEPIPGIICRESGVGFGWARSGGEIVATGAKKHISVDGIHNVIQIMEEMEHGKLLDMDYIEVLACLGGCVGGVLTVENPFITRRRIRDLTTLEGSSQTDEEIAVRQAGLIAEIDPSLLNFDKEIEPRPTLSLDCDMASAIRKMERLDEIVESLPGLDCGSCGAPNCRALAEDIVRELAVETDCIFNLREKVRELAGELQSLAAKLPPAMRLDKKDGKNDPVV